MNLENYEKFKTILKKFNEDEYAVALLIKMFWAEQRPSFILKDIKNMRIDKYSVQISNIYEAIVVKDQFNMLSNFVLFAIKIGKKYKFCPIREIKTAQIAKAGK